MSGARGANRRARGSGRASPEAIEKRRAARRFNTALLGPEVARKEADGRTERRRRRLYRELEEGAGGKRALKPIDVLRRVAALLELGEPLARIRKAYPPGPLAQGSAVLVEVVRRLHRAYAFAPAAYRFVGVGGEVLRKAGVLGRASGARSRRAAPLNPGRSSRSSRRSQQDAA